jgi:hypothetical protein
MTDIATIQLDLKTLIPLPGEVLNTTWETATGEELDRIAMAASLWLRNRQHVAPCPGYIGGGATFLPGWTPPPAPPMSGVRDEPIGSVAWFAHKPGDLRKVEASGVQALITFSDDVHVAAKPTSTRPIPLSALRHQQQRIGLFVPR